MSPRGAVLALAIATSIGISVVAVLLGAATAVGLALIGLLAGLLLNHSYARSLGCSGRPLARVPFDRLVSVEILVAFVLPLLVAVLVAVELIPSPSVEVSVAVVTVTAVAVIEICFASSLVDWYYVLPRRDGLVGEPPCQTPSDERWQRVTWFWFLHRFVAAISVMAGAYVVALCIGLWLVARYPDAVGAAGGIPIILVVISYFRREYLRDIGKVWSLLLSPGVALGEHISIRRDGETFAGFAFNVAIDRVDLLDRDDGMSYVSIEDVATRSNRSNKQALCADGCVRGDPDATGRAPVGGHGGCLARVPANRREPSRPRKRVLVF